MIQKNFLSTLDQIQKSKQMPPGFSGAKMERDGETTMLELKQTCLDDIIDDVDTKKVK